MRPTHRPADAPALIISAAYVANGTIEDAPMLELLDGAPVALDVEAPVRKLWRPDPDRLAIRFERFCGATLK